MSTTWVVLALVLYFILGTAVAVLSRRGMGRGLTEYFLANRTLGGFVAALTYSATTYSAFMMVGLAGFTYAGGVGALGFELIYLCGLVLAVFFGPRFWLVGRKYDYVTPAEMLADRYQNRWVGLATAVTSLVFLIPYSAVQLMGVGYLVETLSRGALPFMVGVVIATLVAVLWAWVAGMRSVAWTDSLQALVMLVVALGGVWFVVERAFGGLGGLFAGLERQYPAWLTVPGPGFFSLNAFVGLTVPWFFFCLSNPQVSQRLFAVRSLGALRRMLAGFLVFGFAYTLVSVLWGLSARLEFPRLASPDLASPSLLADARLMPPLLALLIMVGIMAAAITTVDSIILTLSSMVSRDVYGVLTRGGYSDRRQEREAAQLWAGKVFIPVFALLILLFARLRLGLISALSVASSAGLLVTVPALFGAFWWKKGTAAGVLASIVGGGLTSMYLQVTGWKPWGQWPGVWTLAVAGVLFVVVSLLTRAPEEKAGEFLDYVAHEARRHGVL